jgi:hypothetical protein
VYVSFALQSNYSPVRADLQSDRSRVLGFVIRSLFCWLTLSSLLFILDGRWKLLPKWLCIVLFVLSPMMLVGMARQTAIAPTGATD